MGSDSAGLLDKAYQLNDWRPNVDALLDESLTMKTLTLSDNLAALLVERCGGLFVAGDSQHDEVVELKAQILLQLDAEEPTPKSE